MLRLQRPSASTIVVEVIALILSVWMVLSCVSRWRREFAVSGKSWSGFLICLWWSLSTMASWSLGFSGGPRLPLERGES